MFLDFGWDYQTVERDEAGNVVASNEEGDPSIIYLPVAGNGYGGRCCAGGSDPAPIPRNKPWTITYTVDALHGSRDDFSPAGMFLTVRARIPLVDSIISRTARRTKPVRRRTRIWAKSRFSGPKNIDRLCDGSDLLSDGGWHAHGLQDAAADVLQAHLHLDQMFA